MKIEWEKLDSRTWRGKYPGNWIISVKRTTDLWETIVSEDGGGVSDHAWFGILDEESAKSIADNFLADREDIPLLREFLAAYVTLRNAGKAHAQAMNDRHRSYGDYVVATTDEAKEEAATKNALADTYVRHTLMFRGTAAMRFDSAFEAVDPDKKGG